MPKDFVEFHNPYCCGCVLCLNIHFSKYCGMQAYYGKECLCHAETSVSLQLNGEFSTHELLEHDYFFFSIQWAYKQLKTRR